MLFEHTIGLVDGRYAVAYPHGLLVVVAAQEHVVRNEALHRLARVVLEDCVAYGCEAARVQRLLAKSPIAVALSRHHQANMLKRNMKKHENT